MPRNGETMRLVADLLDKAQGGRLRAQYKGAFAACQEDLFLTRSAAPPLGHSPDVDTFYLQFVKHADRFSKLSFATVYQQKIGECRRSLSEAGVLDDRRAEQAAYRVRVIESGSLPESVSAADLLAWTYAYPSGNLGNTAFQSGSVTFTPVGN